MAQALAPAECAGNPNSGDARLSPACRQSVAKRMDHTAFDQNGERDVVA